MSLRTSRTLTVELPTIIGLLHNSRLFVHQSELKIRNNGVRDSATSSGSPLPDSPPTLPRPVACPQSPFNMNRPPSDHPTVPPSTLVFRNDRIMKQVLDHVESRKDMVNCLILAKEGFPVAARRLFREVHERVIDMVVKSECSLVSESTETCSAHVLVLMSLTSRRGCCNTAMRLKRYILTCHTGSLTVRWYHTRDSLFLSGARCQD